MNNNDRDIYILGKIIKYCDEIDQANEDFGNSFEILKSKTTYKNAAAMCILQIGELITHLTDDFKSTYSDIPWHQIKKMRNVAAHNYGKFDIETLWDTITKDIPDLRDYCNKIIKSHEDNTEN